MSEVRAYTVSVGRCAEGFVVWAISPISGELIQAVSPDRAEAFRLLRLIIVQEAHAHNLDIV